MEVICYFVCLLSLLLFCINEKTCICAVLQQSENDTEDFLSSFLPSLCLFLSFLCFVLGSRLCICLCVCVYLYVCVCVCVCVCV